MIIFLLALIVIASFLLGLFILVQNPKGGGVGSMGGFGSSFSNQFGVKQATNILEKGTYIAIGIIALLSILSGQMSSTNEQKEININKVISSEPPAPVAEPSPIQNGEEKKSNNPEAEQATKVNSAPALQLPQKK